METSKTFSISFWLKKTAKRKNGLVPIYARIKVDGIPSDLSIKRTTLEDHWCPKSNRLNPKVKGAIGINKYLDDVYANLLDCHRQLYSEGMAITSNAIKQRYLGEDRTLRTLEDIIKYHRDKEMPKLEPGTSKNYGATETYLKRFVKKKFSSQDIRLSFIDYTFVVEFEGFLRNCPSINKAQPLTNNGIMKHMERFKKLVGIAFKFRCIPQNPFNQYNMKFEDYDSDFLEEAEIQRLASVDIKDSGKAIVRDIFLFACYTGLSYIEVKFLKQGDIVTGIDGEEWINVKRKKTKTPVRVPLLAQAKSILDKYSDFPDVENGHTLLPVYSNQKVNKYLKIIAAKAQINKHLTFHVARHTFATTITLMNNVPLETVSKLLGHTKLSTTQKYARVVEKKISKDMAQLKTVLKESPKKEVVNGQQSVTNLRIVR
ncbi:site-specific integrase [Flagellimonas sp.]|jgi:integrase|uniref:site-specific integrase n=1 Tax=Flagellimonas sp. TaxID=2058762 RepID=UPI003C7CE9BB